MNTRTLIAYFSRRGENYYNGRLQKIEEGNTELLAKVIQAITGAFLFEIDTIQTYLNGYTDTTRVAKKNTKIKLDLNSNRCWIQSMIIMSFILVIPTGGIQCP